MWDVGGVSEVWMGETDRTDEAVSMDDTDSGRDCEVDVSGCPDVLPASSVVFRSLALCSFEAWWRTFAELTCEYPQGHRIFCVLTSRSILICFAEKLQCLYVSEVRSAK